MLFPANIDIFRHKTTELLNYTHKRQAARILITHKIALDLYDAVCML